MLGLYLFLLMTNINCISKTELRDRSKAKVFFVELLDL